MLHAQTLEQIDQTGDAVVKGSAELMCVRADAYLGLGKRDDARRLYVRRPPFFSVKMSRGPRGEQEDII